MYSIDVLVVVWVAPVVTLAVIASVGVVSLVVVVVVAFFPCGWLLRGRLLLMLTRLMYSHGLNKFPSPL